MDQFHPILQHWFSTRLGSPTKAQSLAWPLIANGENTLLLAPTGSGKTLAAFLVAIDRLMFGDLSKLGFQAPKQNAAAAKKAKNSVRVLYISPLKALAVDVEKNLHRPLAEITQTADESKAEYHWPTIAIRSGDSTTQERNRLKTHPPDILITTPESLFLLLTSSAREILRQVDTVIIDEIHTMVSSKRGVHLFLSLERLEELRARSNPNIATLQRIGLSATQRPLDEVARLLGGYSATVDPMESPIPRPVAIADAGSTKHWEISVEVPVEDMAKLVQSQKIVSGEKEALPSIWPAVIPRLIELIKQNRSTMLFVNNRGLAERIAQSINDITGEQTAYAHHGSVAKDARAEIERLLKDGELPAIVATSSLELGIDMGAVDLVIQIEAPPSIASGLQRIGRAGHQVNSTSRGVFFPKFRGDLLASSAAVKRMLAGQVEQSHYPRNPLDVLAQQIVAMVVDGPINAGRVFQVIRSATPFAELPYESFVSVLNLVSGLYPSSEFAEFKPRVHWDRVTDELSPLKGAQQVAIFNAGTIPDRGLYGVFLIGEDGAPGSRVGELDEEMVFESKVGDVFLLGASSWRLLEITHDRVLVAPAPGIPGRMPFWHGDSPGRPFEFGQAIGELTRELLDLDNNGALNVLESEHGLDEKAAINLMRYLNDQKAATQHLPSDKCIVVEAYQDELQDWRIAILSPFGSRVHAPWATAISARLKADSHGKVDVAWSDDGILFLLPEADGVPDIKTLFPRADEIQDEVIKELSATSLFAAKFREAAARALLLPRRGPGRRTPLWVQRRKAHDLLQAAVRFTSFPILMEAYRECLQDVFDLPALLETLTAVESKEIAVHQIETAAPSPFASSLQFGFIGNFLYDADAPLSERKAQALALDLSQLQELLGEVELRTLLDGEVVEDLRIELQRLNLTATPLDASETEPQQEENWRAFGIDAIEEMLRILGDLSQSEIVQRIREDEFSTDGFDQQLQLLRETKRIIEISVKEETRFILAQDAGRYRDALGIRIDHDLPAAFLDVVKHALADIVMRFARTHVPFSLQEIASRWGIEASTIETQLHELCEEHRLLKGEFLPSQSGDEWCAPQVLTVLKRRSLQKMRSQIKPVEQNAFARFLIDWHGVTEPVRGSDAILDCVEQLQGVPLSLKTLEREILPSRVKGFRFTDLDELCAAGEIVWQGASSKNAQIRLFLADSYPVLASCVLSADSIVDATQTAIREILSQQGAVFYDTLKKQIGGFQNDLIDALWEMVWNGEVTNDTLRPLRSRLADQKPKNAGRRSSRGFRSRRTIQTNGTEGRWTLLPQQSQQSPELCRMELVRQLLSRHGVLTRESVLAESIPGGFAGLYPVLRAMEDAGQLRRGYFIAGLGAAQFVLPGTEERIRLHGSNQRKSKRNENDSAATKFLAATDPANPYGATLPWPATPKRSNQFKRIAGARVILSSGELVGYLSDAKNSLTITDAESTAQIAQLIAQQTEFIQRVLIETINGASANKYKNISPFIDVGFQHNGSGLVHRGLFDPI